MPSTFGLFFQGSNPKENHMLRLSYATVVVAGASMLAGCGTDANDRAISGAAIGALPGALVAGPVGAVVGGAVGAASGAFSDPNDVNLGEPIWNSTSNEEVGAVRQ
jgi:hypothetical protein